MPRDDPAEHPRIRRITRLKGCFARLTRKPIRYVGKAAPPLAATRPGVSSRWRARARGTGDGRAVRRGGGPSEESS